MKFSLDLITKSLLGVIASLLARAIEMFACTGDTIKTTAMKSSSLDEPKKGPSSTKDESKDLEGMAQKRIAFLSEMSNFVEKLEEAGLLEQTPCCIKWTKYCRDDFQAACAAVMSVDGRVDRALINAVMSMRKFDCFHMELLAQRNVEWEERLQDLFLYVGFEENYKNAPTTIMEFAHTIKNKHGGVVPCDPERLRSIPGVQDRNTLILILQYVFSQAHAGIVVDPDVKDFLTNFKWTQETELDKIAQDVEAWLPSQYYRPLYENVACIRQLWNDTSVNNKEQMIKIAKETGFDTELNSIVL